MVLGEVERRLFYIISISHIADIKSLAASMGLEQEYVIEILRSNDVDKLSALITDYIEPSYGYRYDRYLRMLEGNAVPKSHYERVIASIEEHLDMLDTGEDQARYLISKVIESIIKNKV